MDESKLSKKERIALRHQEEQQKVAKEQQIKKLRNFGIIAVIIALLGWGSWWVIKESTKPLPGTAIADLGRDHITDITKEKYNSNPPTSGKHFALWAKRGVYDTVISDGYLIHALEHGYINISYNCSDPAKAKDEAKLLRDDTLLKLSAAPVANMTPFTPETKPPTAVALPASFRSDTCKQLVSELRPYLDKYDRIVIVPRPGMDTKIALTAWNRIQKFDEVKEREFNAFITAFHNKGPESTIE
jgi:hypothetical protein